MEDFFTGPMVGLPVFTFARTNLYQRIDEQAPYENCEKNNAGDMG